MKKIAIVFEGDIYNPRGEFIAIQNRIREYKEQGKYEVDVYVCWPRVNKILNSTIHFNSGEAVKTAVFDDIVYHCIWYRKSNLDYLLRKTIKRELSLETRDLSAQLERVLSNYQLVYANSMKTGIAALRNKYRNNVPYVIAWHGSSIHTLPFMCITWYSMTRKVLRNADYNFFVSKELLKTSKEISENKGLVSLNGIDTKRFYQYSEKKKIEVKRRFGIQEGTKNIAFVGNLLYVKYAEFLPKLFKAIKDKIPNAFFYIVGSGDFDKFFRNMSYVRLFNNLPNIQMPDMYNSMDLIVLPSRNEGLPMTCLEAQACGVAFVGSRVGGIADVVGVDYTVPRTDNFDVEFEKKCVDILNKKNIQIQPLNSQYQLSQIVNKESEVIEQIINQ